MTIGGKEKLNFIFDFDGTIVDSASLHDRAFRETLEDYNLRFRYIDYLGMPTDVAFREIFIKNQREIGGEELKSLVDKKRALARKSFESEINAVPGAVEFITSLHKLGRFQLFVASSGSFGNIYTALKKIGVWDCFKQVLTVEHVQRGKPFPDIFLKIIDEQGLIKSETVVLEDALSGLIAAKSAEIDAICVNEGLPVCSIEKSFLRISYFDLIKLI